MSDGFNGAAPVADALNVGSNVAPSQIEAPVVEGVETEAPVAPVTPAAAKRIKELKLKVHGEEISESLPFEIDDNPEAVEYLTKQLQLSKAAQRAMQENSSFQKQVGQFFQDMKSDSKGTAAKLRELGIDPREFAASVIEEEIKKAQMSPEQVRQQELETELTELKNAAKKKDDEYNERELSRIREIEFEKIDSQMDVALSKSDLPKKPYVVRKMAEYMLIGANNNINLTPEDVLPLVRQELMSDLQEIINSMGEDAAEEFIGKEIFNRARKKNIAKAKVTPASLKAGIKDVAPKKSETKSEPNVNYKNFFGF